MPHYEMHTHQVAPLSVRNIEADSSKEALQQFAEEVNRLLAVGQGKCRKEAERFLVEMFDETGRKIGSVSVHQNRPTQPG